MGINFEKLGCVDNWKNGFLDIFFTDIFPKSCYPWLCYPDKVKRNSMSATVIQHLQLG